MLILDIYNSPFIFFLENLENMCWVCNEPINEAKRVKPIKDAMENMKVEKKVKKK